MLNKKKWTRAYYTIQNFKSVLMIQPEITLNRFTVLDRYVIEKSF